MGYRKLDNVLLYDALPPGKDPSYILEVPSNLWYLGLAGEVASDVKLSKITLPMLSKSTYDWKSKFTELLTEAISLKPQKHVDNFAQAWVDFTKYQYNGVELEPNVWFASLETKKTLVKQIKNRGLYQNIHGYDPKIISEYDVDRRGLELDIPDKVIAILPDPENIGVLCINEDYFNLFFIYDNIQVYRLKDLKIFDA